MGTNFKKLRETLKSKIFNTAVAPLPENSNMNSGSMYTTNEEYWIDVNVANASSVIPTTAMISNSIFTTGQANNIYSSINTGIGNYIYGTPVKSDIVSFYDNNGKEIVKLNFDGSVTWAQDINIDEAAEAFTKTLTMGAEQAAGISQAVKLRMRDSVFETIISIAEEKGSLTADDLTYLLESSKIIEKLKGVED